MKKTFLLSVFVALTFSGCARHYVIALTSGNQITTVGKPKFQEGSYFYTDTQGRQDHVSASRVREVTPASMADAPPSGLPSSK